MNKLPFAVCFVVVPISFIPGSIGPDLHTIALPLLPFPTSIVNNIVVESDRRLLNYFLVVVLLGGWGVSIEVRLVLFGHARSTELKDDY